MMRLMRLDLTCRMVLFESIRFKGPSNIDRRTTAHDAGEGTIGSPKFSQKPNRPSSRIGWRFAIYCSLVNNQHLVPSCRLRKQTFGFWSTRIQPAFSRLTASLFALFDL